MSQHIFQTKSLKRKNLKKLTLEAGGSEELEGAARGDILRATEDRLSGAPTLLKAGARPMRSPEPVWGLGSVPGPASVQGVLDMASSQRAAEPATQRPGLFHNGTPDNQLRGGKPCMTLRMKRMQKPLNLNIEPEGVKSKVVIAQPSPTNSDSSTSVSPIVPSKITSNKRDNRLSTKFSRLSIFQDDNNDIQLEDLVQLGKIGAGNSGTVVKTLHVPDSRIIAKKSIPVENSELVKNQLMRELTIMKNVKEQKNIVGFYGAYYTAIKNHEIIILMEYMDCGSLDKISSTYRRYCSRNKVPMNASTSWFTELSLSKISYAVLNGLSYLYQDYKIIHRDIKPSNILINSKGFVKICDFGVSKKMIDSIADTFVGTSTYMSPERIQGSCYNTKGDVWSLGLMIIELVTGEFPLGGHNDTPEGILDLLQRIVNEEPPSLPASGDFSADIMDFVNCCCVKDERKRSSLQELMTHRYITKYNDSDDYQRTFRHWCKKIKKRIKADKMIQREEMERARLVNRQLERSAQAAMAARSGR
ncbi:ACR196Cp [Eremothecium gossypii ATCC 10895]|uniref:mitogen-activated protein kinase kinase n=1 Tax=Eremothecium gossypii (strain ATCC 10895 / CBS 109.51 / FGSC 9923 / NRRL Y-1056) TaxID=284811 RepID=Q75BS5_EREGS|nr:ACR196Cp [Eremothecium gossypii ATCC 10895]AAS51422.1 ACR196Cp [Eremothecium gossypii ATCC 10895]AEY95713.1 FACR196Cp [Eremothecium gossypii FDAG1]